MNTNILENIMDILNHLKPVSMAERETLIRTTPNDDIVRVYTSDRREAAKYLKLCTTSPEHYKVEKYDSYGLWITVQPKSLIRLFSKPARKLTTEERAERAARFHQNDNDAQSGAA